LETVVIWTLNFGPALLAVAAWLWSGPAERYGLTVYCASIFGTLAFHFLTGRNIPVVSTLAMDTGAAVVFLLLAIRYNSIWLGVALVLNGLQLTLHAMRLTDGVDPFFRGLNLYALGLNIISLLLLVTFAAAVAMSRKGRRFPRPKLARRSRAQGAPAVLARANPDIGI